MSTVEGRLKALGIELPSPAAPVANYVPWTICGSILTISGQLPFGVDGKLPPQFLGRVAGEVSEENGRAAAQQCAVNVLAQVRAALGSFERVKQCQRPRGFFFSAPHLFSLPAALYCAPAAQCRRRSGSNVRDRGLKCRRPPGSSRARSPIVACTIAPPA